MHIASRAPSQRDGVAVPRRHSVQGHGRTHCGIEGHHPAASNQPHNHQYVLIRTMQYGANMDEVKLLL